MSNEYGIQLDRAVESVIIADRHRTDFGDIEALAKSLTEYGLLQPPTITPEGFVLVGARRVKAAQFLGWRTINVWVRSGLSDRLGQLLSEHADHTMHKPLTTLEAASLYRELKAVFEEEAALRQTSTRFVTDAELGVFSGGDDSSPPENTPNLGKSRSRAARMVTGRDSHQMLDRVNRIEDLTTDPAASDSVRAQALAELDRIRAGEGVLASHQRMNAALSLDELDQIARDHAQPVPVRERARQEAERARQADLKAAEMERLARAALDRIKHPKNVKKLSGPRSDTTGDEVPTLRSSRAFLATWSELDEWWRFYDAHHLLRDLTDDQIDRFITIAEGTLRFAEELHAVRVEASAT